MVAILFTPMIDHITATKSLDSIVAVVGAAGAVPTRGVSEAALAAGTLLKALPPQEVSAWLLTSTTRTGAAAAVGAVFTLIETGADKKTNTMAIEVMATSNTVLPRWCRTAMRLLHQTRLMASRPRATRVATTSHHHRLARMFNQTLNTRTKVAIQPTTQPTTHNKEHLTRTLMTPPAVCTTRATPL